MKPLQSTQQTQSSRRSFLSKTALAIGAILGTSYNGPAGSIEKTPSRVPI